MASTCYSIDGGPVLTYSAPFTVSAPGSHAVTYFSTDNAGNVEQPQTGYVNIDTTVPTTKAQPAAVRAGKTVMLKFRVADAAISCGEATVKIQHREGRQDREDRHRGREGDQRSPHLQVQGRAEEGDLHLARAGDRRRRQHGVDRLAARLTVK